jgi:hypothetical protein
MAKVLIEEMNNKLEGGCTSFARFIAMFFFIFLEEFNHVQPCPALTSPDIVQPL